MDKLKSIVKGSPFIITLIYVIVGSLWIQYSDQAVLSMFDDASTITQIQSYKGWFYVLASGGLIYFLVYQSNLMIENLFVNAKKEHDKFEATFEYAPVGIAHNKPNEKWILVNRTLCRLLGYNKNELLNLSFEDFIHPEDIERGRQLDKDIIEGTISSYTMEKRYKRKDGSYFTGKVSKGAVLEKNNTPKYLITVLEDITKQKEHEAKLNQMLEEKEILLAEVHHRVNNNIALMSALLELELMYSSSEPLNKVLEHFKTSWKTLSLIYRNFTGVEKEPNIDFSWFLNEQINFLKDHSFTENKEIEWFKNIDDIDLNVNQAIPVALICNEILAQISRKCFDKVKKPVVKVSLTNNSNQITFEVEHNGQSPEEPSNLNDPDSIDARIMDALVKQIEGNIELSVDNSREVYKLNFEKGIWKGSASYNQPQS